MKDIRNAYSVELSFMEDNCTIFLSPETKPDILNTPHNTLSCALGNMIAIIVIPFTNIMRDMVNKPYLWITNIWK